MKVKLGAWALACAMGMAAVPAVWAQSARAADYIVAVVNSEPITNAELLAEVARVERSLRQQKQAVPAPAELRKQVLERLINERAQLQLARETGIRIDAALVEQAEQAVARQSGVDVAELHKRLASEGLDVSAFRERLRNQQLLERLYEREVGSRNRVSEQDIDQYLQEMQAKNNDPLTMDINLAQILVALPEKASAEQAAALFAQAQKLRERIRQGESFEALVQQVSAADRSNGGQLGLRRGDRYPGLFVQATKDLPIGGVSEVVRSGAGFHILKVVERRAPEKLTRSVVQTHARHILLRTGPELTQAQAIERLAAVKKRIASGATSFAAAAREMSQDGSAAQGGDLGWANPGMFVPEFEEVMNKLDDLEISAPLVSRFGVHLLQVIERRKVDLNPRELRELARMELRESRYEKAFESWAQEVRGRAFVEYREAPQ
ncbi:peptidylprolyl isomerase [Curvibacter sp. APW13]|uniref:peptidylprolyl isomerase n=1 Tax=Curvibacter sp. APW13 TaxID=3077236 RepID=UPI0028DE420C|nr:peptidylprolyl isomerase [Curvibacter sp. APW13]MDT8990502.1 peptidylprolyl isomerase [Curvibacter sp. APW13]